MDLRFTQAETAFRNEVPKLVARHLPQEVREDRDQRTDLPLDRFASAQAY